MLKASLQIRIICGHFEVSEVRRVSNLVMSSSIKRFRISLYYPPNFLYLEDSVDPDLKQLERHIIVPAQSIAWITPQRYCGENTIVTLILEYQQGHTAADATRNICSVVAPSAVSHSTAKYWFQRFREGDFSLKDRARSGRPSTLDVQGLNTLIISDPAQTTRKLAEQLGTSHSTVERHLHEQGMKFKEGKLNCGGLV